MAANDFLQNGYMYNEHLLALFLTQRCTHCLPFLLSFICSWLSNKPPPAIINNLISLLSMSTIFKK